MVGALVVTHGNLARELVSAAKKIVGESTRLEAVTIGWEDEVAAARVIIEEAIEAVDQGDGMVLLTDMFGGTPTNLSLSFLKPGRVEIVTGINLPMLVKFLNLRGDGDLLGTVRLLREKGQQSIQVASEILGRPPEAPPKS